MAQAKAQVDLRGDKRHLDKTLGQSKSSVEGFGKAVKKIMIAVGAAIAVREIISFGKKMLDLAGEQEAAETRLASVIEATGGAAGFTAEQMKVLASEMQKETTIGDEVILNAQAIIATFKNIRGDTFIRTTKAAADMAEVLQTDLKGASMQVAKALNDPVKGMTMLTRAGVTFSDSQKDMVRQLQESGDMLGAQNVILEELESQFGGAASAAADTFSGKMKQMQNRVGDIGEQIGFALMPALEALAPVLDNIATFVEKNIPLMRQWGEQIGEWAKTSVEIFQTMFKWFVVGATAAFTAVQVIIENWKDTAIMAFKVWALDMVVRFETIKWILTKVIPEVLMWFARNWTEIFTDIASFYGKILENMMKNAIEFGDALVGFFKGGKFEFKWTGLTEGFRATLDELPQIAARTPSDLEKQLMSDIVNTANKLGNAFNEKFNENMQAVGGFFDFEGFELPAVEVEEPDLTPNFDPNFDQPAQQAAKAAAGQRESLTELQKRISTSAGKSPELEEAERQTSIADQQRNLQAETLEVTRQIRDQSNVALVG